MKTDKKNKYQENQELKDNKTDQPSGIKGGGTDYQSINTKENTEIQSAGDVGSLNDKFNQTPLKENADNPSEANIESKKEVSQQSEESYDPSTWPAGEVNEEGKFGDERSSEEAGNDLSIGNP